MRDVRLPDGVPGRRLRVQVREDAGVPQGQQGQTGRMCGYVANPRPLSRRTPPGVPTRRRIQLRARGTDRTGGYSEFRGIITWP